MFVFTCCLTFNTIHYQLGQQLILPLPEGDANVSSRPIVHAQVAKNQQVWQADILSRGSWCWNSVNDLSCKQTISSHAKFQDGSVLALALTLVASLLTIETGEALESIIYSSRFYGGMIHVICTVEGPTVQGPKICFVALP